MDNTPPRRRLPIGAEVQASGVHFRVWAPACQRVEVVLDESSRGFGLESEGNGYHSGLFADARAGSRYRYRLDGAEYLYPDPASRFQPEGPHGPSRVIDPASFAWTDGAWPGVPREGQVIYELHVGTLTPAGDWQGAIAELPALAELGVTVLEVMPLAEFPGDYGWGYDGVDLFAPTRLYGSPDDFRRFVDRAHALGIGVILDVVYNHFGPDGCYLKSFSPRYFTDRHKNEWGEAINFDDEGAGPVREFFIANAGYWIDEFHLDGLRLDATQAIHDSSTPHILTEIQRRARAAAGGRKIILVSENEPQHANLVRPESDGGRGLDMLWNDDYHHSANVILDGHNEAYYTDYSGTAAELLAAAKWGYLYQGQRYKWQKARRGTPTFGLDPCCFVNFLQNHDQVANSAAGLRAHALASPGHLRAMTALTILMPGTPMLFQGDEYAASAPFLYFAHHNPELAELVRKGRAEFLEQFPSIASPEVQKQLARPDDRQTFERCKLNPAERERNRPIWELHRDLIRLRKEDPALRAPKRGEFDGAVLGDKAFCLRYFSAEHGDRLLLVNAAVDLALDIVPEPLLAPPLNQRWRMAWSSESVRYGGLGACPPEVDGIWRLPGRATLLLIAERVESES